MSSAVSISPEWLEARRSGLGGSDAAAALGMSPWKSPAELWREKLGLVEPEEQTERQRLGLRLESVIADEYTERTGKTLHRVNRILRHPEHPFMLANIDRRIVGEKAGFEAKSVDKFAFQSDEWGEPGTDEVPTWYLLQVAHYLCVTGWERFDLAALVGGNELRIYTVRRDEELIAELVQREREFWRYVETQTEPPIASTEEAKRRWPQSVPTPIEATPEIAEYCATLRKLKAEQKKLESDIETVDTFIRSHMGECDTLTYCGATLATWKTSKPSKRPDHKRFFAEHPELAALAAQYEVEFTTRRFLLKGE